MKKSFEDPDARLRLLVDAIAAATGISAHNS